MDLDPLNQAILLCTVPLGRSGNGEAKALTALEWARVAQWLIRMEKDPSALLGEGAGDLLAGWNDPKGKIPRDRLERLLVRGGMLALTLERWDRAGIWIMTRADKDYPKRLKRENRLGPKSPPVLFGCGERSLVDGGGLAVVGSRNASEEDLAFTLDLGRRAARESIAIVSGCAKGVDRHAMTGVLEEGGTSVGVVPAGLLRAATSVANRSHLMDGNLALVSPFPPESRFAGWRAMTRNKHIYCLADAAVVIASAKGSGGTWTGALENLKHGWIPLWVHRSEAAKGNAALVRKGGKSLPSPIGALTSLFRDAEPAALLQPLNEIRQRFSRGQSAT